MILGRATFRKINPHRIRKIIHQVLMLLTMSSRNLLPCRNRITWWEKKGPRIQIISMNSSLQQMGRQMGVDQPTPKRGAQTNNLTSLISETAIYLILRSD